MVRAPQGALTTQMAFASLLMGLNAREILGSEDEMQRPWHSFRGY